MKGEFRAQLPGKVEGDYYVVSISYSGEGEFNGQDIVERHPRKVGKLEEWDCLMKSTANAMTLGLFDIETPEKYNSLEELATAAFGKGMHKLAWTYAQDSRYNDNKGDSGV
jgi:hypothetical protein